MIHVTAHLNPSFQPIHVYATVRDGEIRRILWGMGEEQARMYEVKDAGIEVVYIEIRQIVKED